MGDEGLRRPSSFDFACVLQVENVNGVVIGVGYIYFKMGHYCWLGFF
jgi:hypothetical protein